MTKSLLLLFVWMLERAKTNEGFMIHRDQYSEIWRQENVPEGVIKDVTSKYEYLPAKVVYAIATDDSSIGIGALVLPYTNQEVTLHDLRMLLAKNKYPVTGILKTQSDFAIGTIIYGLKGLGFAAVAVPVAVVGATIGGIIMLWRAM